VTAPAAGRLLKENGFSLQGTAEVLEGEQYPDRDAQFRCINGQARDHQAAGEPVISVDAKKKEQTGLLPHGGAGMAAGQAAARGRGPQLLRRAGGGIGDPVRDLRHDGQHRLGQRRYRPQHGRVRGRLDPALVDRARTARLPRRLPSADHRGRRRLQQLPLPLVEG
jgi:hypothetical protein